MNKSIPLPGNKVRGSHTGRPVMVLLDLLGRRWTLRILWELRTESKTFRQLQAACGGASPSVMNSRLRELRDAGLVAHESGEGYALTAQGVELNKLLQPLDQWSKKWGRRFEG